MVSPIVLSYIYMVLFNIDWIIIWYQQTLQPNLVWLDLTYYNSGLVLADLLRFII